MGITIGVLVIVAVGLLLLWVAAHQEVPEESKLSLQEEVVILIIQKMYDEYTNDINTFKEECPWSFAHKGDVVYYCGVEGLMKFAFLEKLSPDMYGLGYAYENIIYQQPRTTYMTNMSSNGFGYTVPMTYYPNKIKAVQKFVKNNLDNILLDYAEKTLSSMKENEEKDTYEV